MTRLGDFERKNAVFSKSRAGKKRRKRPLSCDGPKIEERSGGHENRIEENPENNYNRI